MSLFSPFDPLEEDQITDKMMAEFLEYNPETGHLIWKSRKSGIYNDPMHLKRWNDFHAGQRVGSITAQGYIAFRIFGKNRKAHRVIWLLQKGKWPKGQIDHDNGVKHDNKISNLKDTTPIGNMRNRKLNANSKTGFSGVYWCTQLLKWKAHIKDNRKPIHLGYFDKFEDAVRARLAAEKEIGFNKNHGRVVPMQRSKQ